MAMIKIGDYNTLAVKKLVDFGAYLDGGEAGEILLPARYIETPLRPGDELEVFIYTDSEDRLIATTEHPLARVGEFAYLQVVAVNRIGAFLDWGLPKNLLVPFREQKQTMREGCQYLVYVYLDDASKRVAASAKIDKFLGNVIPDYAINAEVDALVIAHEEPGYRVIVDNLHRGIIDDNEIYAPLEIGTTIRARVKQVRRDGKIDLTLNEKIGERIMPVGDRILELIHDSADHVLMLHDHSSPEEIKARLHCSKKDFKRAVGQLYKARRIVILPDDGGLTYPNGAMGLLFFQMW